MYCLYKFVLLICILVLNKNHAMTLFSFLINAQVSYFANLCLPGGSVTLTSGDMSIPEGGTGQVCVTLGNLTSGGLECNVNVSLTLVNSTNAG